VIMAGFLHRQVPVWVRRLVTVFPPMIVIMLGFDPTRTLVISQVILSFGLPFAIVPLVMFTRRRDIMGTLVNHGVTTAAAMLVAMLVLGLNMLLLYQVFFGG
jgi:manganese transport protein